MIYECPKCGITWNIDALDKCPNCGFCPTCEGLCRPRVNRPSLRRWIKQAEDEIRAMETHIVVMRETIQLIKKSLGGYTNGS